MQDMELLKTRLGKMICCAAMIDDVASLILLAMISSIALSDVDKSAQCDDGVHAGDILNRGFRHVLLVLLFFSAPFANTPPVRSLIRFINT